MKPICTLFLALLLTGCGNPLDQIQERCKGVWRLDTRQMADGTILQFPAIEGEMCWLQLDSRRAHITICVSSDKGGPSEKLDYAASTYEISTSAISRNRHLLVRRGYRPIKTVPLAVYGRARKARGVIKLLDDTVTLIHESEVATGGAAESFTQVYRGDTMTASYSEAFTDTWTRVQEL